jgi:hypothetical protein
MQGNPGLSRVIAECTLPDSGLAASVNMLQKHMTDERSSDAVYQALVQRAFTEPQRRVDLISDTGERGSRDTDLPTRMHAARDLAWRCMEAAPDSSKRPCSSLAARGACAARPWWRG